MREPYSLKGNCLGKTDAAYMGREQNSFASALNMLIVSVSAYDHLAHT